MWLSFSDPTFKVSRCRGQGVNPIFKVICPKENITAHLHQPYSSDLIPCNFRLFHQVKTTIKGKCFESVQDINAVWTAQLKTLTTGSRKPGNKHFPQNFCTMDFSSVKNNPEIVFEFLPRFNESSGVQHLTANYKVLSSIPHAQEKHSRTASEKQQGR